MCGILAILGIKGDYLRVRQFAISLSRRLKDRGPDARGIFIFEVEKGVYNILSFERLSICDPTDSGLQPFVDKAKGVAWIHNGEIFNYPKVKAELGDRYHFHGRSDSESVGVLYQHYGKEFLQKLDGMFGICVLDLKTKEFIVAKDHVGIIPLYCGVGQNGEKYVASELKAIHDQCKTIEVVRPGHWLTNDWVQREWYQPKWHDINFIPQGHLDLAMLRHQLTEAVREQLMGDVPFGVLISGGVDSSLIAAIVMRLVKSGEIDIKARGMTEVPSFCIGLEGSPDLVYAKKVADFIGTKHHEFIFTVEEGVDAIPEVLYYTETFNPTTIRASTPMYLMSRKIKALGTKMVLTGEGADEIFGGYLYFHKAPNREEFHKETVRKVKDLYKYDLLRANKSCQAWGVEVRPPFLHKSFIEYAMSIDPTHKVPKNQPVPVEKYILRKAFDDETNPYIPKEVLWRQKEQFSDGVGYKWIDGIKNLVEKLVTDEMFENREKTFPVNPPFTKEMYWERELFESYFPSKEAVKTVPYGRSIACSTSAALEWDETFKKNIDESGRAVLGIHSEAKIVSDAGKN